MGSGTASFWGSLAENAVQKSWEILLNSENKFGSSEVPSHKRLRSRSRDPFEKLGSWDCCCSWEVWVLNHPSKGSSFGVIVGAGEALVVAVAAAIEAGIGIPGGGGRFSGEKREFMVQKGVAVVVMVLVGRV